MRDWHLPQWLAAVLASACLSIGSPAQAPAQARPQPQAQAQAQDIRRIHHEFRLTLGDQHIQITMRVLGLERDRLTVAMPAWKPGSYRMIHFGKVVQNLKAADATGKPLPTTSRDESWSVPTRGLDTAVITYQLPLKLPAQLRRAPYRGEMVADGIGRKKKFPLPRDASRRRDADAGDAPEYAVYQEAYEFEGPHTWLYVPGRLNVEQRATFHLPEGWSVASGMKSVADTKNTFSCPDFDVFADCPFHIGKLEELTFRVSNVPHRIVLSGFGGDSTDRKKLVARYERLVQAHHDMWGEVPYEEYVFLIKRQFGGGLEHLNSTNMGLFNLRGGDGLASHEFFHTWNVKRLRPKALGPFDYSQPNRTRYLWVCEGVTSYYGELLLVRAGLLDEKSYWTRGVRGQIDQLQRNPGRLKESVADASWRVWDFPYMRRGLTAPDYYNKGFLLGLLLDVEIRDASDGKHSLDEVMRGLYKQCMTRGCGFEDGDVRAWCEKVAGRSFKEFFADYVDGTKELPYNKVLAKVGVVARPRAHAGKKSKKPGRGQAKVRRRAARWTVTLDPNASKRALRLRAGMMQAKKN